VLLIYPSYTMLLSTNMARRALIGGNKSLFIRAFSTDQTYLIVNAVGADRPGIVSELTKYVTDVGGNVGASQAARLGSHFSLMMQISVPNAALDTLKTSLTGMKTMNASVFETENPNGTVVVPAIGYSGYFTVSGADNPGIVHKVTSVLAKHGLSIEKVRTSQEGAPHGGTTLFLMEGTATAPEPLAKEFSADKIKAELEELGNYLNCDVSMVDTPDESVFSSFYGG